MRIDDHHDTVDEPTDPDEDTTARTDDEPEPTGAPQTMAELLAESERRDRVSLSIRQLETDPWSRVGTDLQLGQDVDATITRLMPFGAFARIAERLEGLIHASELSDEHVADPSEVVRVGDHVRVRIVRIEPERRRLSLSIRQAGS